MLLNLPYGKVLHDGVAASSTRRRELDITMSPRYGRDMRTVLAVCFFLLSCQTEELQKLKLQKAACDDNLAKVSIKLQQLEARCAQSSAAKVEPGPTAPAPTEPKQLVGSRQIIRAYSENEVSADQRFKHNWVYLVGRVQDITKHLGKPSVTIGPQTERGRITCLFDVEDDVAVLQKTKLAILKCYGGGVSVLRNAIFEHCSLVEPKDLAAQFPDVVIRDPKKPDNFLLGGAIKDE